MKVEEFCEKFLKAIKPNDFRMVTKELMMGNGLYIEFESLVGRGILIPKEGTDKYFINWDLLKSYIEKQLFDENEVKLFLEMKKEIDDLKEQVKEIDDLKEQVKEIADSKKQAKEIADLKKENTDLKEQVRRLQNELNAKEKIRLGKE